MTPRQTLATFGCSWMAGVGSQYIPGVSETEYRDKAWSKEIEEYCFRNILARRFNLANWNFSQGGASNDYNFEQASIIFGDAEKKKKFLDSNPIVLWGITSTARLFRGKENIQLKPNRDISMLLFLEEPYINAPSNEDLKFILQDQQTLYSTLYLKLFYDHESEVRRIGNQIEVWNDIFEYHGVPVIWFDTFNHHAYPNQIRNFFQGGDLLTQMLAYKNLKYVSDKKWYHLSDWTNDDDRIDVGVKNHLLNPFTYHPGQDGHKILAEILAPSIHQLIN
jgi:hypothetical protein